MHVLIFASGCLLDRLSHVCEGWDNIFSDDRAATNQSVQLYVERCFSKYRCPCKSPFLLGKYSKHREREHTRLSVRDY